MRQWIIYSKPRKQKIENFSLNFFFVCLIVWEMVGVFFSYFKIDEYWVWNTISQSMSFLLNEIGIICNITRNSISAAHNYLWYFFFVQDFAVRSTEILATTFWYFFFFTICRNYFTNFYFIFSFALLFTFCVMKIKYKSGENKNKGKTLSYSNP